MAKLNANLVSLDGIGPLQEAVRSYVKQRATKTYRQVEASVLQKVREKIRSRLLSSNVTQSLLSGKLKSDFGLTNSVAARAVSKIIDYVSDNVKVSLKYSFKGANIATFSLDLLPMGTKELSMLPEGNYVSTGKFGGGDVTWLTWLVTQGTTVVIGDYYVFENPEGNTRAGSVMQKATKRDGFRVDPSFAGTVDDNFVIRALQPIIPEIKDQVFRTFSEALK